MAGLGVSTAFFLYLELRRQTQAAAMAVAVTDPPERMALSENFSTSNSVSVILGKPEWNGGIVHLPDWSDGWTRVDSVDGVSCRYMNHRAANLAGGAYVYFAVHPTFKQKEIKAARIEFEYLVRTPVRLKLQYDGNDEGQHRSFKPAQEIFNVPPSNGWQTVEFHLTEPVFMNSQHGGADFRLDVNPPEIYVRRVTLTRGDAQARP